MRASVTAMYGSQFRIPTKTGRGAAVATSASASRSACRNVISFSGERPPIVS